MFPQVCCPHCEAEKESTGPELESTGHHLDFNQSKPVPSLQRGWTMLKQLYNMKALVKRNACIANEIPRSDNGKSTRAKQRQQKAEIVLGK
jgi:hypothetical protein